MKRYLALLSAAVALRRAGVEIEAAQEDLLKVSESASWAMLRELGRDIRRCKEQVTVLLEKEAL